MRNDWFVLGLILFVGALPASGQETVKLAPLPEGDTGIAAKYPGDAGIEQDPAVIFHDGFEDYATPADLGRKWDTLIHEGNMRIAEEPDNVNQGKKSLECAMPQQRAALAVAVNKVIKDERDVLFLRFYSKFEKGYDHPRGSSHNGGTIAAHYNVDGRATPGIPADGRNKFLVNFETERGQAVSPGPLNFYCYHAEQGGPFGDHIYPTGKVVASGRRGVPVKPPVSFGPHFVSRPDVIPKLDRWYCYEFMVKANTPGQRDGRIACWVDGKLIADFPNMRLRDVEGLKIDCFGVGVYLSPNTARPNRKWYDDVVAATSYIGPMVPEKKTSAKP